MLVFVWFLNNPLCDAGACLAHTPTALETPPQSWLTTSSKCLHPHSCLLKSDKPTAPMLIKLARQRTGAQLQICQRFTGKKKQWANAGINSEGRKRKSCFFSEHRSAWSLSLGGQPLIVRPLWKRVLSHCNVSNYFMWRLINALQQSCTFSFFPA